MPRRPTPTWPVSKSYSIITPESAADGDYAEHGMEWENVPHTLRDIVAVLRECDSLSCSPVRSPEDCAHVWACSEPSQDYRTGNETEYAIHIKADARTLYRMYRLAGLC